jgi:hypothetical protein
LASTSIYTLEIDIQELLKTKGWFGKEAKDAFAEEISSRLASQYQSPVQEPRLRLSQMGPQCPKALWHSINTPEQAQPFPPWTQFKFSLGHVTEGLAISLAKGAGHSVVGEQDELVLDGVKGHRDCIIDGHIVDVKSCNGRTYQKIKEGGLAQDDLFGYLWQLDGYMLASSNDPLVSVKDKSFILAVHKELGHMCLYEHKLTEARTKSLRERIARYKRIVEADGAPPCECELELSGSNRKLGVRASYSQYKYCCFPNLRCFLYSGGPVYLTEVKYEPSVPEIDKYGKIIRR